MGTLTGSWRSACLYEREAITVGEAVPGCGEGEAKTWEAVRLALDPLLG